MPIADDPASVIAGEAVSGTPEQRWNDMVAIASVMANRAALTGTTINDVASVRSQFNAFGKSLPAGAAAYVGLAQQALDHVATYGPVNDATYYATPAAVDNLPAGLTPVGDTTGHQYFSDPAMRGIVTAQGAIRPNPANLASNVGLDPLSQAVRGPYAANGLLNGVTSLTSVPAQAVTSQSLPGMTPDAAFAPNGMLAGAFPASSFTPSATPAQNSFGDLAAAGPMGGQFATVNERMGIPNNPATSDFASLAEAGPMGGPFATVNERMGIAPVDNGWADMANAGGPMAAPINATPTGILGQPAQLAASAVASPVENVSVEERMGIAPSTFDAARFGDIAPASFDTSRFAGPTGVESVMATPQSYMDAPQATPSVNNFGDMASAGPMAAPMDVNASLGSMKTPNLSASDQVPMAAALFSPATPTAAETAINTVAAPASVPSQFSSPTLNGFADMAAAGPMAAPVSATATGVLGTTPGLSASLASPVSATATGILGGVPGLQASAAVPSISAPAQVTAPTQSGLLSGVSLTNATPSLSIAAPNTSMISTPVTQDYSQYQSFTPSDVQEVAAPPSTVTSPVNVAQDPAVSLPNLTTISVPSQPTVAAPTDDQTAQIDGPATTAATSQQAQNQFSAAGIGTPTTATRSGILGGMVNKGSITGGILGGVVAGPVGGILGGILGNQVNKSGGLTGLLGNSQGPMSFNNLGSGMAAVQGVYGSAVPGQQAMTNNGGFVTSLGNGATAYTSPDGVTTHFTASGQPLGYNGPSLSSPGGGNAPSPSGSGPSGGYGVL